MGLFDKIFGKSNKKNEEGKNRELKEGDFFYTSKDEEITVFKLLVSDVDHKVYHVAAYESCNYIPTLGQIENISVWAMHLPIATQGFENPILIGNVPVKFEELAGYYEYLRQSNNFDRIVQDAKMHYEAALKLTDKGNNEKAIIEYSKSAEIFPQFFEAIDNRGFCRMNLGQWQEAIKDFELSLATNPNSLLAEFSIGECLMRLGDFSSAKIQFEKCLVIDPMNETSKKFLQAANDKLNAN